MCATMILLSSTSLSVHLVPPVCWIQLTRLYRSIFPRLNWCQHLAVWQIRHTSMQLQYLVVFRESLFTGSLTCFDTPLFLWEVICIYAYIHMKLFGFFVGTFWWVYSRFGTAKSAFCRLQFSLYYLCLSSSWDIELIVLVEQIQLS